MHLILFDDHSWDNLLPLTFTRPVAALRVGIVTIAEKWDLHIATPVPLLTYPGLPCRKIFPVNHGEDNLLVNGALLPNHELSEMLSGLPSGKALRKGDLLLGARMGGEKVGKFSPEAWLEGAQEYKGPM